MLGEFRLDCEWQFSHRMKHRYRLAAVNPVGFVLLDDNRASRPGVFCILLAITGEVVSEEF